MPCYSTTNSNAGTQQALAVAYKTLISLTAATASLTSFKLYDILIGTDGTPTDTPLDWDVSRQTAAGTGSSVTPNLLDPTTRAAGTVGVANYTAEGTITANSSVFFLGANPRASYRWVANPGGELIAPNTNLAGFALRAKAASYTGTATGTLMHSE